jgi:D-3-phosphoglycerate dehydrogenase / 2-oxoglutarate reductase
MKKVLHLDSNHPVLWEGLEVLGYQNEADYTSSYDEISKRVSDYEGLIIRSRIPIDRHLIEKASKLQFIGRVGAGLENIDLSATAEAQIQVIAAPEGNRNAVAEHAIGMLLNLLNRLRIADAEVRQGIWKREANRGVELAALTVGIIGYGHMGKQLAKRLSGFGCAVLCYDILPELGDEFATQVPLDTLYNQADVISLHTPQTAQTTHLVNAEFIAKMHKPFWLINTARGSAVDTKALLNGLASEKVKGAALDVLEYENKAFTSLFDHTTRHEALEELLKQPNVLLSPHIAGWTHQSHYLLAKTVLEKIKSL